MRVANILQEEGRVGQLCPSCEDMCLFHLTAVSWRAVPIHSSPGMTACVLGAHLIKPCRSRPGWSPGKGRTHLSILLSLIHACV